MSLNTRWRDNICLLGNTVAGTVTETASRAWEAHGCDTDWQDVNLGQFKLRVEAKSAVEDWVASFGEPDEDQIIARPRVDNRHKWPEDRR